MSTTTFRNKRNRFFFFSSRRQHTICYRDWSSDVCSSDLPRIFTTISIKAALIEIVVNIRGHIIFDSSFAQTCARRPFTSDLIQSVRFQTMIARFLKDRSEERRVGKESRVRSMQERRKRQK